jgi:hypothetical protein
LLTKEVFVVSPVSNIKLPFESETIDLIDLQTGRKFQAVVKLSLSNSTIFCDVISKSSKILGSMILGIGKRDVSICTLRNDYEGKIAHVGSSLTHLAKRISESLGLKGRLSVFATKSAHPFFYIQGFIPHGCDSKNRIEAIESAIKLAKETKSRANTFHLPGMVMRTYTQTT